MCCSAKILPNRVEITLSKTLEANPRLWSVMKKKTSVRITNLTPLCLHESPSTQQAHSNHEKAPLIVIEKRTTLLSSKSNRISLVGNSGHTITMPLWTGSENPARIDLPRPKWENRDQVARWPQFSVRPTMQSRSKSNCRTWMAARSTKRRISRTWTHSSMMTSFDWRMAETLMDLMTYHTLLYKLIS